MVVETLVARRSRLAESPLRELTPREADVLREMAQGKTNAAIAAHLNVTESAVEKYANRIFSKLGLTEEKLVHRRVSAVLAFLRDISR
jgi:DNA-binding NarL/FixJ family response regulator